MTFKFDGEEKLLAVSMRDCFIPDPGKVWIKWDGDQAEARLLAYTSGATKLIEWIANRADLHWENAKVMWPEAKIPTPYPDKKGKMGMFREGAKPCMYALSYSHPSDDGKSHTKELFKQLKTVFPDLSESYLEVMVARFFEAHPEIRRWQQANKDALRELGKITLPQSGDFLYLPATMRGFNQAGNFQMQSGLGALINRGLIEADGELSGRGEFLAQVHDELDAQILEKHVDDVDKMVSYYLSKPANFGGYEAGVPFAGDRGPNWADVKGK